jgi:hypothetical protein
LSRKCYISFKTENIDYKNYIQDNLDVDMIDKSLNEPIDSDNQDYIMRKIREDYLSDSTVTIHLIGAHGAENSWFQDQTFIKRELQASLYDGKDNSRSGILGVVLPSMHNTIYQGQTTCLTCGCNHTLINIGDNTTVKEFSVNYFIPHDKCAWNEDERYCVLVSWDQFKNSPNEYIEQAFEKRTNSIANQVTVYPK